MQGRTFNYVLLLAGGIALFAGLSLWAQPAYDPDLGWHLFGGSYILTHNQVPHTDLINSFSTRWHDYHWLGQVLLARIYNIGGYRGLSIALGGAAAAFSLVLFWLADRERILRRSPILTLLAILFMLVLIAKVTSVRPQVISLLALALSLVRLKGRERWYEPLLLFLLAAFVANVHVYWIFIPVLYFLYRVLPPAVAAERKNFYLRLLTLLFISTAAFISPYGLFHDSQGWVFENYALIYDYLLMPDPLKQSIGELQSAFASGGYAPIMLVCSVALFVRGFRRSDLTTRLPDMLAAISGLVLAIQATKFLAIFALLSFPYFLLCLFRVTRALRRPWLRPKSRYSTLVLAACFVAALFWSMYRFPQKELVTDQLEEFLPIKACSRIAELPLTPTHGRDHVRVMTHFNYGGWCRWIMFQQAPEKDLRVTIDGRTQWFPPEYFTLALDLYNARFDWQKTLYVWAPDVVLVPMDKPLASVLALAQSSWKLEYSDQSFAVFTPIESR